MEHVELHWHARTVLSPVSIALLIAESVKDSLMFLDTFESSIFKLRRVLLVLPRIDIVRCDFLFSHVKDLVCRTSVMTWFGTKSNICSLGISPGISL